METLRGVFPTVPTEALLRVLEICDQSVAVASAWLLENDWQDLMLEDEEAAAPAANIHAANITPSAANITPSAANVTIARDADTLVQQNRVASTEVRVADRSNQDQRVTNTLPPHLTRGSTGLFGFEAEFDSEDEDEAAGIEEGDEEEDEEEDEDDVYYDSGDELGFRVGGVPPMTKRAKVFKSEGKTGDNEFWVAFDDQVMTKSMIDLLNTTLTKLAHSKVVLLSQPVKEVEEVWLHHLDL
uniref:CUE domain-containing protein n=1 Tax=Phytophthora ramorum TaxID=164328 RepID=H3GRZ5_PHYRM